MLKKYCKLAVRKARPATTTRKHLLSLCSVNRVVEIEFELAIKSRNQTLLVELASSFNFSWAEHTGEGGKNFSVNQSKF